jgi:hypothetical protein
MEHDPKSVRCIDRENAIVDTTSECYLVIEPCECDLAVDARTYDGVRDVELHELPNVSQVVASTIAQDLVSMLHS